MRKYLVGFIVGLATITTLTFAVDYSDIDWYGAHRDRGFKKAVKYVVENCSVSGYVENGYLYSSDISC